MEHILVHTSNSNKVTCVSNVFIDEYMKDANGEYVKIYLYLLRCLTSGQTGAFSISKMADALDHTEKDINRALQYWERMHILSLEYNEQNELTGICLNDSVESCVPATNNQTATPSTAQPQEDTSHISSTPAVPTKRSYSADEVKAYKEDENIKELFFITQTYIGHPLSMSDMNTMLYWYDQLHFSTELIEYLVEYCIEKGHPSLRYMDKVALGWHESHITSITEAKENASIHSQAYYAVMKAFGISGRNLIKTEIAYIDKWTKEYGFTLDIITEACKRTILSIQKPSFEYADTILTNWNKNQVHHLEDIAKCDASHIAAKKNEKIAANGNNRFINFSQRTYDYDDLEAKLLQQ